MTDPTELTRRTMLTFGSLGAFGGALVLAGCAADVAPDDCSEAPTPDVTEDPSVEPSAAPDAPAVGDDVAALADVPVGGSIDATINGEAALDLAAHRRSGGRVQRDLHAPAAAWSPRPATSSIARATARCTTPRPAR